MRPEMMNKVMDLAKMAAEDLNPDLQDWIVETELGPWLKHPLVYEWPIVNGWANHLYRQKIEALARAREEEDLRTTVFLHERPYRCDALITYGTGRDSTGLPVQLRNCSQEVREVAVSVWTDSENIHEHVSDWMHMTNGWQSGDPLLLANDEERKAFEALPENFQIWRGDCVDGGWSWTTDRRVAEFFARRFDSDHDLLTGMVNKKHVFGYITRRNESEIMVRREHVSDIRVVKLKP